MKTERDYQVRVPADDWREFETIAERESIPPTVLARALLKRYVKSKVADVPAQAEEATA